MYNCFNKMMDDIFNQPDFVQYCYINGIKYKCIASTFSTGVYFSPGGTEDTTNFYLDIHIKEVDRIPKINQKVIFRDKQYKIQHLDDNSAINTTRLYLSALSKGK